MQPTEPTPPMSSPLPKPDPDLETHFGESTPAPRARTLALTFLGIVAALAVGVVGLVTICAIAAVRDVAAPPVLGDAAPLDVDVASYNNAPGCDFTCDTTPRRMECSASQRYDEIIVWNAACTAGVCVQSSTPVFIGGSLAMTTATGMPICNTTACASSLADLEVKSAVCVLQAGSVHVTIQVAQ